MAHFISALSEERQMEKGELKIARRRQTMLQKTLVETLKAGAGV